MKTKKLLRALLAAALVCATPSGFADFDPVNDDTDIFLANPNFNAERPNILIVLDNTANWNTPFAAEKSALVSAFSSLAAKAEAFNIGLMMFTETGTGNSNTDGAYVRYAVRQMSGSTSDASTNLGVLSKIITDLDRTGDASNGGKAALAMMEAYRYFAGKAPQGGGGKNKADWSGNTAPTSTSGNLAGSTGLGSYALNSKDAATYNSPITDGCQKNFIIYISNGKAQDNASDLTTSENELKSLNNGVTPTTISLSNSGSDSNSQQGNWADEWAKYMASADCNTNVAGTQTVTTYVLDVGPSVTIDPSTSGKGWSTLLKSMATNGKGKYFAIANNASDTASQIASALTTIFSEVQAVNSVFASTTLPVSVNVRGTNLNQVYIGVFRPDADKKPRWLGNLKLYKLNVDTSTNTVFLADAAGDPAENSSTGFISSVATSFWTAPSCYWKYLGNDSSSSLTPPASCDTSTIETDYPYWSDSPDGDKVERGGAAQRVRTTYPSSQATRNVYTCTSASGGICATNDLLSATPFSAGGTGYPADNTNVTAADLGAYTTYSVSSISASGTTATVQLAGTSTDWPATFFSTSDTVRISGASPSTFNGDFTPTSVDSTAGTFTYTLSSAPSGTTAIVTTSTDHHLNTGDLVTVSGASPADYNVTNASIVRLSATTFSYTTSTSPATSATTLGTITGKKAVSSVTGTGTAATATFSSAHNYSAVTTSNFSITGSAVSAFNVSNVSANTSQTSSASFTTSTTISGTANAATVTTSQNHELRVGDSIVVSGATPSGYNCTAAQACTVTAVTTSSPFTFTYSIPSGNTAPTTSATVQPTIVASRSFTNQTLTNGSTNQTDQDITASLPTGTTSGVTTISGTSAWKVVVSGAVHANFNTSSTTITATGDTQTIKYSVSNSSAPPNGSTSSTSGTMTVSRSLGSGLAVTVSSVNPVVSDTTAGMYASVPLSVSTIASQSGATGTITAGRTSDADSSKRSLIINWVRGSDNKEDEDVSGSTTSSTDVRTSVHGDVLHSRPAVINFNRYGNDNDIYAFYGGNDGMLHALKGGFASSESGVSAGDERWAFVPREFFPYLSRLRDNTPTVSSTNPRNYGIDGPISVYQKDANNNGILQSSDGDTVNIFFAARRGGRYLYALDVTTPHTPKFLWRANNSSSGFSDLGQTWSEPKVAKIKRCVSGTATTGQTACTIATTDDGHVEDKVVLVMGGGYDANIDDVNPCLVQSVSSASITLKAVGTGTIDYTSSGSCNINNATGGTTTRNRSMGRAIYVIDASDGSVLWAAGASGTAGNTGVRRDDTTGMTCAIPSDVTVIDIDRNGYADRGYVGDMCGNVWRIDFTETTLANWPVYKIASLSSTTATDVANQRKFLFPPDVVFSSDSTGSFAAILLGSGDREHPFDTNVVNRFYMIKDRNNSSGVFNSPSGCTSTATAGDPITDSALFDATSASGSNECGFKLTFAAGEKNVGSAVTLSGTTFFNTNQPSATAGGGACGSNLGIARQYLIGFSDASAQLDLNATGSLSIDNRSVVHTGGGYLPSPVPAVVELNGKKYEVVISGTAVKQPAGSTLDARYRTYWYKEFD